MRALTVRQPFAWAIAHGHKPVENRTWAPPLGAVGERIAIHAAVVGATDYRATFTRAGLTAALADQRRAVTGVITLSGVCRKSRHTEELDFATADPGPSPARSTGNSPTRSRCTPTGPGTATEGRDAEPGQTSPKRNVPPGWFWPGTSAPNGTNTRTTTTTHKWHTPGAAVAAERAEADDPWKIVGLCFCRTSAP